MNNADSIREHGGDANVAAREVSSGHVHQILKDCQGNALGHVDHGSPGRIPAAAGEPCPYAVETRVTRPAYAEKRDGRSRRPSGRDVVFDAGKRPLDEFDPLAGS